MDSKSANVSGSSSDQQGRYIHPPLGAAVTPTAVPHTTTQCGILENTSKAVERFCLEDYYEPMSPGLDDWRMESGAASLDNLMSNKGAAASEGHGQHFQMADSGNLLYKKSHPGGLNMRDPRIRRAVDLNLPLNNMMATQAIVKHTDCVHDAADKSTEVRPVNSCSEARQKPTEVRPVNSCSEGQQKSLNAFKNELVEHIKLLLNPAWKQGRVSKDDYKSIVKKITIKILESIPEPKIPDTPKKVEEFLAQSEQKMHKIVRQYLRIHQTKGSKP